MTTQCKEQAGPRVLRPAKERWQKDKPGKETREQPDAPLSIRDRAFRQSEQRKQRAPEAIQSREAGRQRVFRLTELRKQHGEQVARTQELLRAQLAARRVLRDSLQSGPRSVPQLAEQAGMAAHEVLWHIAAMKKYGVVMEAGMDETEDYYLYGLSEEVNP